MAATIITIEDLQSFKQDLLTEIIAATDWWIGFAILAFAGIGLIYIWVTNFLTDKIRLILTQTKRNALRNYKRQKTKNKRGMPITKCIINGGVQCKFVV